MHLTTLVPILLLLFCTGLGWAQTTATLTGVVNDPAAGPIAGARVTLSNAVIGLERTTETRPDGTFHFVNIPLQSYVLRIEKDGFASDRRSLELRSNVPVDLAVTLQLSGQQTTIDVNVRDIAELVEPETTGTRTEI